MDGWNYRLQSNLARCEAAILLPMAGIAAGKIALQPAIPAIHCKIVLPELRPSKCSSCSYPGHKSAVLLRPDKTKLVVGSVHSARVIHDTDICLKFARLLPNEYNEYFGHQSSET